MKCPRCGDNTKDAWKPLQTMEMASKDDRLDEAGATDLFERTLPLSNDTYEFLNLEWMRCEAEDCFQTLIRAHETTRSFGSSYPQI